MKRYILLSALIIIIGGLIFLSSVYLVKAEFSLKRYAQLGKDQKSSPFQAIEAGKNEPVPPKQAEMPSVLEPEPFVMGPIIKTDPQADNKKATPLHIPSTAIPLTSQETPDTETEQNKEHEGPPLISMDLENANLKDVLKIFCQQSGLNFIAGENVKMKPVTLYLNNVDIDSALDSIISANDLSYESVGDSNVFIVRESTAAELKTETKIFNLQHAFAESRTITAGDTTREFKGIKDSVQKLLSPNGDLIIDERTNILIVTDIPARFEIIERAITNLDVQIPQVMIEAKMVELSSSDVDQLGIKWTSLAGYTLKFQDPTRTYTSDRTGGQDRTDTYTTDTNDSTQLDRIISGGTTTETTTIDQDSADTRSLTDTFTKVLSKSDVRSAILTADDFEVTLSLLLQDRNVDIISSPNLVTSTGQEAKIIIGVEYPIPEFAYNDDTATFEVQGFSYKDIGVILKVIPYIAQLNKTVTMDVFPEVSHVSGSVLFRGIEIPIVATRQTSTNITIRDGETLAIGGLLKDEDGTTITKIPVLGDIPIIGRLFKHKEAAKTKTNLIIFVTPHILYNTTKPVPLNQEVTFNTPVTLPSVASTASTASAASAEESKKNAADSRPIEPVKPKTDTKTKVQQKPKAPTQVQKEDTANTNKPPAPKEKQKQEEPSPAQYNFSHR